MTSNNKPEGPKKAQAAPKAKSAPEAKTKAQATPEARSAAQSKAKPEARTPEQELGKSLEQLSSAFTASARRWELIVYPSLVAFIILAGYGFFLIYSLTKDVQRVATSMDLITLSMDNVSQNMVQVADRMEIVAVEMRSGTQTMNVMVGHMQSMNSSMHSMAVSVDQIRYQVAVINNSVSRPMQFMNSFMPW